VQDRFRLLCGTEGNSEPNNVRFIIADLQDYTLPDCAPARIMLLVVFLDMNILPQRRLCESATKSITMLPRDNRIC